MHSCAVSQHCHVKVWLGYLKPGFHDWWVRSKTEFSGTSFCFLKVINDLVSRVCSISGKFLAWHHGCSDQLLNFWCEGVVRVRIDKHALAVCCKEQSNEQLWSVQQQYILDLSASSTRTSETHPSTTTRPHTPCPPCAESIQSDVLKMRSYIIF